MEILDHGRLAWLTASRSSANRVAAGAMAALHGLTAFADVTSRAGASRRGKYRDQRCFGGLRKAHFGQGIADQPSFFFGWRVGNGHIELVARFDRSEHA
jgi:hypothetical protein